MNSQISCLSNKILKTAASQGDVVARFRTMPDSYRWIEPRTLSDRTAVIFSFQFFSVSCYLCNTARQIETVLFKIKVYNS